MVFNIKDVKAPKEVEELLSSSTPFEVLVKTEAEKKLYSFAYIKKNYKHKECEICGWFTAAPNGGCDLHHIIGSHDEYNCELNLILLCPNCHRKVHCGIILIEELINIKIKELEKCI